MNKKILVGVAVRRKTVSGIMLSLLLIGMLALAFNIQRAEAAEPPETEWSRTYGGENPDHGRSVVQTSDGGYAIAGITWSFGAGVRDVWLVKTDAAGTLQWNQTYGGTNSDYGWSLVETSDGGYAIAGGTSSYGAGAGDVWLVKIDSAGTAQWNQTYGGTNYDHGRSVVQTSDGGYAIAGSAEPYGAGARDVWLVKIDSAGTAQWNQTYGGTDWDEGYSVVETSDGGYAVAGSTYSYGAGNGDFWLINTDASGNEEWSQTYGGTGDELGYSLLETSDGGYAIAGETGSYGAGAKDAWLVKTDSAGTVQWTQTYGGTGWDYGYSVVETSDGGYALAGRTESFGAGSADVWLVKTDAAGTLQWNQTYGGTGWDYGQSVVETSDGGYAIAGETGSYGAGGYDVWLVKVGFAAKVFHVVLDSTSYIVTISSNSTITNFKQQDKQISFNVTGESGITGYCNVTIPESLLKGSPWTIKMDNTVIADFDEKTNDTHTFLYFNYTHENPLQVTIEGTWIVPEFPQAIILPLFMILSLTLVVFVKLKEKKQ